MLKFYRYHDTETYGGDIWINLQEFDLVRETPKGYWISESFWRNPEDREHFKKWIPKISRRRYAYPTKEEAIFSFKARKKMQIKIVRHQLGRARKALEAGENFDINKEVPGGLGND